MRTQRTAQLPLLEVVDPAPTARAVMARKGKLRGPLSPEMTVRFCNDLLAALDRAEEARQSLQLGDGRAEHLANLFEAAVRTNDAAASSPRRRQGAA